MSRLHMEHTPMAKTVKYPTSFRKKLEKRQAKREARATAEADDEEFDPNRTFWRAFLGKNTVHTMYSRIDEVLQRITTQMTMKPEFRARRHLVRPPWEGDTTGGVSE